MALLGNSSGETSALGLEHVWTQGDAIAKGTMIVLAVMSIWSWYIILTKLWDQHRMLKQARQAERNFWAAGSIKQAVETLKGGRHNAFREIAQDGLSATQHHEGKLTDQIDLNDWITQSLQRSLDSVISQLQGGLAVLASVGSVSPFVGLFGTVWGILTALLIISEEGQATIDKIAGPVGEALIMTAFGLFVAVPAVLGYNWLLRRNKVIIEHLRHFSTDLHSYLLSGARVGDKPTPTPRPAMGTHTPAAR